MNKFEEKQLDSIVAYKGSFLTLYKDKVKCPNGNISYREYLHHPGAVGILAQLDGKFILETQYRYPIRCNTLEIPAGKIDNNESPIDAAIRELEEETGYKANNIKYLGKIHSSVGFTDEVIYLYYANDLVKTNTNFDSDEFIELNYYSIDELKSLILSGAITDSKTICSINMFLMEK